MASEGERVRPVFSTHHGQKSSVRLVNHWIHVSLRSFRRAATFFRCHRHGRPRMDTPRAHTWVTGTGRSPGFRVIARFFRLPGLAASGIGRGLYGYSCGGSFGMDPEGSHRIPIFIRLAAEPIPRRTLVAARECVNAVSGSGVIEPVGGGAATGADCECRNETGGRLDQRAQCTVPYGTVAQTPRTGLS